MAIVVVTGVAGCIGSWIAKHLLEHGHEVFGIDLTTDDTKHRLLGITGAFPLHKVDVCDAIAVEGILKKVKPDAVIHLASFLMPKCKAEPLTCVEVNVSSMMMMLDFARHHEFAVVYASSAWVYAPGEGNEPLHEGSPVNPQSLYGVFKHTNEGMARIYGQDFGVPSSGFRPYVVYGPGRDVGLTADVNNALLAAARGKPCHIGFGGDIALHHASDVAKAFILTALTPQPGGNIYNLRGAVLAMREVVSVIEKVTNTSGLITFDEQPLPIAANLSDEAFQRVYGPFHYLSLEEGMTETLRLYQSSPTKLGGNR